MECALCCTSCIFYRRVWYHALSPCCAHAMHLFDVRASSSPHRLPLCQISFLSCPHCWASLQRKITKTHIMLRLFFIVECGITCFLCTMRVFEVRGSTSSLGYLCAKFRFFWGLRCWASPWRKTAYSVTQSIYHSLTQLIWCPGNRSLHFRIVFKLVTRQNKYVSMKIRNSQKCPFGSFTWRYAI